MPTSYGTPYTCTEILMASTQSDMRTIREHMKGMSLVELANLQFDMEFLGNVLKRELENRRSPELVPEEQMELEIG